MPIFHFVLFNLKREKNERNNHHHVPYKMFGKTFLIEVIDPQDSELYEDHSSYHAGDSGLDLFVTEDTMIGPGETKLIGTGIKCQSRSNWSLCPWTCFRHKYHSYFLFPRSSISKTPLMLRNSIGLIDSGYTGEIKAPLYNTSSNPFYLKRGERYVQLVNADLSSVSFQLVQSQRDTTRGQGGFGSTN